MTEIGNAIITEYVTEVHERIEDDKITIRASQGLSIVGSVWRLLSLSLSLFFNGCLVLAVVFLLTLDAAVLDALRSVTNDEILSAINTFVNIVWLVVIASVIFITGFTSRRYIHNVKQERLDRGQEQAELIQTMIKISEELLLRHGLIKAESVDNG